MLEYTSLLEYIVAVLRFGMLDGNSTRAWWTAPEKVMCRFLICNVSPSDSWTLRPASKQKLDIFGALLSIFSSLPQPQTSRYLSRCSMKGTFKQTISSQYLISNRSKAKELQSRHPNSSPVIQTSWRYSFLRLLIQPSSAVGQKEQLARKRLQIESPLPLDKSEYGNLYFAFNGSACIGNVSVSSSIPGVTAIWIQFRDC